MKKTISLKIIFFTVSIIWLLSGCKVLNPSVMFTADDDYDYSSFEKEMDEYVIRPFDKLDLRIYTNDGYQLIETENNSNVSRDQKSQPQYMVEYDGMVKVPTLGRISVSGLTIKQTEELLEKQYMQYYQKPFVLINVTNRRVVVFTSGSTNGVVLEMENERFTLIEALAKAGGIDDFSKSFKIKLLRGDLNNPQVYLYNIRSIEDMKQTNMVLQANDVIYVEKRPRYASKVLEEMLPYIALLNTALLLYITFTAL